MLLELQVMYDLGHEQAAVERAGVDAETREDLFRRGGSTHDFPAFEHQHLQACFRQVGRGYQPVVTGSDDNGIVG